MKLAIIIPYRDRPEHLAEFIPAVRAHLAIAWRSADLFIVEQCDEKPFNRGKLCNVGFNLLAPVYTHVVFHDVDMLPETADYSECEAVAQLVRTASQFGPAGAPVDFFGGVTMFTKEAFAQVNGFNNNYWGWGCEDDDLLLRCRHHGLEPEWRGGVFRSLDHALARHLPEHTQTYRANYERLQRARASRDTCDHDGLTTLEHGPVVLSQYMGATFIRTRL